jgi:hypothetical protein
MADVFFRASKDALDNITAAFDNVHPLTVSLRYTRRVINEALSRSTGNSEIDYQRIIDPDASVHGVNYKRAFIETSWATQEENLAWLLLNNLFAIHEGWAQRLYDDVFHGFHYQEKSFIKNLEFPGLTSKFSNYYVTANKLSNALDGAFFNAYKTASGMDFNKLENYMLCYRFFKEARNCYMHHNFDASQQLIDAYNAFLPFATSNDLDVSEVPIIIPPVLGHRVELNLRGVIGFSQLVRRIIIITDINLLRTTAAEKEFIDRKPIDWTCKTLSADATRSKGQINRYSGKSGFLKASWTADYQQFLINNGIFRK